MKKQTMADKMAQKAFFNPQFQQSWAVHQKSFGPILKPAFVDDYQAKVHLCAALGHIGSKNLPQALLKLNALQKHIHTDADKAAFLFFMGLFCEYAGRFDQMAELYTQANALGHRFYLPYLKAAKFAMDSRDYGPAAEGYRCAIGCFDATGLSSQDKQLLGSSYTNLASCLVMMHRYEEADAALSASRELVAEAPGRAAPEAILHAIRGEAEAADACLDILKAHAPTAYDAIRKSVEGIAAGTEHQFFQVPLDEEKINSFWHWFSSEAAGLKSRLDHQDYEAVIASVGDRLLEAFPFLEARPYVALGKNNAGYVFQLKDCYSLGTAHAYEELNVRRPDSVKAQWLFDVVH